MKKIDRTIMWEASEEYPCNNHKAIISKEVCMVKIADLDALEAELEEVIRALIIAEIQLDEMYSESEVGYIFSDNPKRPKSENILFIEKLMGRTWEEIKPDPPQEDEG